MNLYFSQDALHLGAIRRGFSLVELSIVLVILGLLVGGVLSGQSLIRAAELRKVASGIAKYQTAMASFKDKYFALPGDMPNATSFWGALDGGAGVGSSCFTIESTDTKTCNGDGNGFIGFPAGEGSGSSDAWTWGERFHVWVHLADAGLIEGHYTGRTDSTSNYYVPTPGKNVPSSGIASVFYDLFSTDSVADATNPYFFAGFDARPPTVYIAGTTPIFTPAEAWGLDTKMDDGRPGTGKIVTKKHSAEDCADSDTAATANYELANTVKACSAFIARLL